jgi:putative phage-type endonuclease
MARILAKTKGMSVEDWRKLRRNSLGGSDASAVVGLNRYKSEYSLWADKKGYTKDIPDNEAMRVGRDLEQYVAERFMEATGKKVRRRNAMFMHDDYDFLTANIDREVIGENAGLECKTTMNRSGCKYAEGEVEPYYYCQCMHYMEVMGYDVMYLAVLVFGDGFYCIPFYREERQDDMAALVGAEIEWWNKYITDENIPEADGSKATSDVLADMYPRSSHVTITANELSDKAKEYKELKAMEKKLKSRLTECENVIKSEMGDAEKCICGDYEVTWKNSTSTRLDTTKIKKEAPEIYDEYAVSSINRRFIIKEVKDNG